MCNKQTSHPLRAVAPRTGVDPSLVSGIVKATGVIALVTLLARIAGFARYLVFGANVGAGDVGTAYASANLIPSVLFEVAAGGALASMVIPLVAGLPLHATAPAADAESCEQSQKTESTANEVVSVVLLWTLILTLTLAVLVAVFAEPMTALIFGARDAGAASMTQVGTRMLRIFAIQLPLYALTIVFSAFLQSRKRFFWPAVAPLISSLTVMVTYWLYSLAAPAAVTVATLPPLAESLLAWGTTGGVLAMTLSVALPAIREGLRPRLRWRLPKRLAKRAWALAGAGIVAVAAQQMVIALILLLATRAGGLGTLPLFQYSQAVYLLPFAILIVPVMTSVFPHLSELRLVGDLNTFSRIARGSMTTVVSFGAIGGAALWGAAVGLEVFFKSIDRTAVAGVGSATAALAFGLASYGIVMHTTRILNAQLRALDALIVGAVPWGVAALLIVFSVLTAPTRRTADAATLFGLCIAAGMVVGAIVAFAFLEERVFTVPDSKALRRAVMIALGASAASSLSTLALSRAVSTAMTGPWTAVAIGGVCGTGSAALCVMIIALCDRTQAREVMVKATSAVKKLRP